MIAAVLDASVIIKWFHQEGESEVAEARGVLRAVRDGKISAFILDLTVYEIGNVLLKIPGASSEDTARRIDDLLVVCGAPLSLQPSWRRDAAELAATHGLTYYDAAYAAAARGMEAPLITADRRLLASSLAESATDFVQRMRLRLS